MTQLVIATFKHLWEAEESLAEYEQEDVEAGTFTDSFFEIVEIED